MSVWLNDDPSQGRDPARLERIVGKLLRVWQESPQLRLGQLVINHMSALFPEDMVPGTEDGFYYNLEDDLFEKLLDSYLASVEKRKKLAP